MAVFGHRENAQLLPGAVSDGLGVAMGPFQPVPAVVLTTLCSRGLIIDLFPGVLPDVRQVEIAILGVKGELPGVAQSPSPDLRTRIRVIPCGVTNLESRGVN